MRRPPQRMHHPPHSPLARLILRRSRTIQVPRPTTDQHQTRILLLLRFLLTVLADKVMRRQLGRIQDAVDIDVDNSEVWFLRSGRVVGEDVVLLGYPGVGDDVVDIARGGEEFSGGEESELVVP